MATLVGCAVSAAPTGSATSSSRILLAYDDGRAEGSIAFPDMYYETVVRFELPPGEHRVARLWLQAASPGTIRLSFYEQTALDTPGAVVFERPREVRSEEVTNGRDGRWLVEDVSDLPPSEGIVWLGIKRVAGEPTIAASNLPSKSYFVRSTDPKNPLDLLPVKRTPLVRIELAR